MSATAVATFVDHGVNTDGSGEVRPVVQIEFLCDEVTYERTERLGVHAVPRDIAAEVRFFKRARERKT